MSDAPQTESSPINRRLVNGKHSTLVRVFAFLILAGVVVYVGMAAQSTMNEQKSVRVTQARAVVDAGLSSVGHKTLASKFTDSQNRLLADPPASADQYLNPDVIVIAHIDGPGETPGTSWEDWENHLSQLVGKKVVDQTYDNSADQVTAAGSGKVTLLALHAADTPFLVNNYGFEPVAALADQDGVAGNRMDLVVTNASLISKPSDLLGKSLVCTVPSSITGYRAAIATLMRDYGLRPNVDYQVLWSLKQKESISGVATRKYEAASVSDEKLQATLEKGKITASEFRIIYQTPVIQRTTIGYFYNLDPQLAQKLKAAILTPMPTLAASTTAPTIDASADVSADASSDNGPLLHFVPVDYKKDFEFVRDMDDQFDPRFDAQRNAKGD